jgi:hypothetical protein
MAIIVTDTADSNGCDLPFIAILDFSHGDMEFIADTADNGLYHHSFALEGLIFRNPQVDLTDTDIHYLLIPVQHNRKRYTLLNRLS